jgi:hypothetical protein
MDDPAKIESSLSVTEPMNLTHGEKSKSSLYRVLPSQGHWIRLVRLGPGHLDEPLRCELVPVDLSNTSEVPSYEPISYAWGENAKLEHILCDKHNLPITANLFQALLHFRYVDKDRLLWADGICIDQSDEIEKNHQVSLMGEVYSLGKRTLVWLGNCDETHKLEEVAVFIQDFNQYTESLISKTQDTSAWAAVQALNSAPDLPKNHELIRNTEIWNHLEDFFHRPWFERLWVLQEVGLSSEVLAQCGTYTLDFSNVVLFGATFKHLATFSHHTFSRDSGLHRLTLAFTAIWSTFGTKRKQSWIQSKDFLRSIFEMNSHPAKHKEDIILNLLYTGRMFQASDSKDRIYAFLSHTLLKDLSIQPNYSSTLSDAYITFFEHMVRSTSSLNILCYTQNLGQERDAMSSWVPQWHNPQHFPDSIPPYTFVDSGSLAQFNVSNFAISGEKLHVEGLVVDTVKTTTKLMKPEDWEAKASSSDETHIMEQCWRLFAQVQNPSFFNHPTIKEWLLAWTLVAGRYTSVSWLLEDLVAYCRDFCEPVYAQMTTSNPQLDIKGTGKSARFLAFMTTRTTNRTFFSTQNGRCGMADGKVEADDIVALIFGCNLPLILRKHGNGLYRLIGISYVEDVILGSAIKYWKAGSLEKENIILV